MENLNHLEDVKKRIEQLRFEVNNLEQILILLTCLSLKNKKHSGHN